MDDSQAQNPVPQQDGAGATPPADPSVQPGGMPQEPAAPAPEPQQPETPTSEPPAAPDQGVGGGEPSQTA